jgi:hypothetical protein
LRESWGWWSIGSEAEVKLGPGFAGASALKVRLQAFTPPGTSGLDVIILLDGVQVGSWRFEPGPIGDVVEREVNLGAPIEAAAGKVLRFRFSRTFVPKDTVGGTDERQLALGLIDITR